MVRRPQFIRWLLPGLEHRGLGMCTTHLAVAARDGPSRALVGLRHRRRQQQRAGGKVNQPGAEVGDRPFTLKLESAKHFFKCPFSKTISSVCDYANLKMEAIFLRLQRRNSESAILYFFVVQNWNRISFRFHS